MPPNPGVTSALGCLLVDIRHDLAQSYLMPADQAEAGDIEAKFGVMEDEARERLEVEGVAARDMVLQRAIDMMYEGQWRSLAVSVGAPFTSINDAVEAFHRDHEREYAFRRDDAGVDLFRLNLTAIGITQKAELQRHELGGPAPRPGATRPVAFDGVDAPVETPIYRHEELSAGSVIDGPAIIEQLDSTTVIPPDIRAEVDEWLNTRIYVTEVSK